PCGPAVGGAEQLADAEGARRRVGEEEPPVDCVDERDRPRAVDLTLHRYRRARPRASAISRAKDTLLGAAAPHHPAVLPVDESSCHAWWPEQRRRGDVAPALAAIGRDQH